MITKINEYKLYLQKYTNESVDSDYWSSKLPEEKKIGTVYYVGKNITWYGEPGKMVVVPIEDVHGLFGNIYDQSKIDDLVDKIENSINNFELITSYAYANKVDWLNIREHQVDYITDYFEINNDGYDRPYSTGDEELDKYIGAPDIDDVEIFQNSSMREEIMQFFKDNYLCLVSGKKTVDGLKKDIEKFKKDNHLNDEEFEDDYEKDNVESDNSALEDFLKIEEKLLQASIDGDGDFGKISIQLRDGHHRWQAAIKVGENYMCVDLVDDDIKEYKDELTFVTNKYKKDDEN
jgi:hypothetical protein